MLIAISIILVSLIFTFREAPKEQNIEVSMMKRYAWESLEYLNYNRSLRENINSDNESVIENYLDEIIPANMNFDVDICSAQCDDINIPKNETVAIVDYYISGYRSEFINKKVRMWVWA